MGRQVIFLPAVLLLAVPAADWQDLAHGGNDAFGYAEVGLNPIDRDYYAARIWSLADCSLLAGEWPIS